MAKKVNCVFNATLIKNPERGGAWIARVTTNDEGMDEAGTLVFTAWSNASAGKRWVKEMVQQLTPKKSCKMVAGTALDAKGKPTSFNGTVNYKREA